MSRNSSPGTSAHIPETRAYCRVETQGNSSAPLCAKAIQPISRANGVHTSLWRHHTDSFGAVLPVTWPNLHGTLPNPHGDSRVTLLPLVAGCALRVDRSAHSPWYGVPHGCPGANCATSIIRLFRSQVPPRYRRSPRHCRHAGGARARRRLARVWRLYRRRCLLRSLRLPYNRAAHPGSAIDWPRFAFPVLRPPRQATAPRRHARTARHRLGLISLAGCRTRQSGRH